MRKFTIEDLLNMLDGWGIVYEDEDLVIERLQLAGLALFDEIGVAKNGELHFLEIEE